MKNMIVALFTLTLLMITPGCRERDTETNDTVEISILSFTEYFQKSNKLAVAWAGDAVPVAISLIISTPYTSYPYPITHFNFESPSIKGKTFSVFCSLDECNGRVLSSSIRYLDAFPPFEVENVLIDSEQAVEIAQSQSQSIGKYLRLPRSYGGLSLVWWEGRSVWLIHIEAVQAGRINMYIDPASGEVLKVDEKIYTSSPAGFMK